MVRSRERRSSRRVRVRGAAALLEPGYAGVVYELEDLSLDGARLAGTRDLPFSDSFGLVVRLPTGFIEPRARLVRCVRRPGRVSAFGIEFEELSRGDRRCIVESMLDSTWKLDRGSRGKAMVVDGDPVRRSLLSEGLRQLDYSVVQAATPLEAMVHLQQDGANVDCVIVAPRLSSSRGGDFLCFVAETFPEVKRVLLSPAGGFSEDASRADALLVEPWALHELEAAMDLVATAA